MKNNFVKFVVLAFTFLNACGDAEKKEEKVIPETKIETKQLDELHPAEYDSIVLDNGSKWIVVPEMMKYIKNMEADVLAFEKTKHTGLNEYTQLADRLQSNIDLLTSNCTMEGPAHDELHKWLLPYIQMVDQLSNAKNTEEAQVVFNQINRSFKTLNEYFK